MKMEMAKPNVIPKIKPSNKFGNRNIIDDLTNQVSLLNIVSEPKPKIININPEVTPKDDEERKTPDNIAEVNQIENACGEDVGTNLDSNQNVIESKTLDDIVVQTNNLTLGGSETETSDDDDEDEDEGEGESGEASTRGPEIRRRNYSSSLSPYEKPGYKPSLHVALPENGYYKNYQNNLDFNISPNILTDKTIPESSQLLLSGGGVIPPASNVEEKINNIKEYLKSPDIVDLLDFDELDLTDFDGLEDSTTNDLDCIERFISDNSSSEENRSSFSSDSNVSSPVSNYGDQVVSSPSCFYPEQPATPTLYFTAVENSSSPIMPNVNNDTFQFTEESFKKNINGEIPILPKLDMSHVNVNYVVANAISNTKPRRATGPRNVYLSHIDKKTRDLYHKKTLRISDEGLLIQSKDGMNFLQTAIVSNLADFAVYFAHLMKLWINKSPKPKGLESISEIETFVNNQDNEGRTALYLSTLCNQANVAGFLFDDCNADIEIAAKDGQTPLHIACQLGEKYLKIVQIFCKEKSKINLQMRNAENRTPLHEAVHYHSKTLVINDKTAVKINNLPIVQHLLSSGARIDVVDQYGFTPIHLAVKNRRIDVLEKLHEFGSLCGFDDAINMKDNENKTACDLAFLDETNPEKMKMIEKLLPYGARPAKNLA